MDAENKEIFSERCCLFSKGNKVEQLKVNAEKSQPGDDPEPPPEQP
jgi:hypothetical protein